MFSFVKTLHVLAVALWFGAVAFFSVAGVLIFQAFQEESARPRDERPLWLPLPAAFEHESPGAGFPSPLRLEQGSRAAGVAVSKVFPVYYGLQLGCGVVALLTALATARSGEGKAPSWRIALCALAVATVAVGWWLERKVHDLREPRNELTDVVLLATSPTEEQVEKARQARAAFGRWHGYSLIQNFATLALTAAVTVLAAHLPVRRP
jgi:hypothetical protein